MSHFIFCENLQILINFWEESIRKVLFYFFQMFTNAQSYVPKSIVEVEQKYQKNHNLSRNVLGR